jgi:predicted DNA-binding protein (MmcQ/YjbR family)
VTRRELRRLCLGFSGTTETFPFGPETSVFKVEGKLFAINALCASLLRVSLSASRS